MIYLVLAVSLLLTLTLCLHTESFLLVATSKNDRHRSVSPSIISLLVHVPSKRYERNNGEDATKSEEGERTTAKKGIASTKNSSRVHRINFMSPLLDYGYPPAVKELVNSQKKRQRLISEEKPVLLYLPGFDGTYISPFIQFPELSTEFEIWCLTITMEDRSTYEELKVIVLDFLKNYLVFNDDVMSAQQNEIGSGFFAGFFGGNTKMNDQKRIGRPIYITGESFGGILALDVALTILTKKNDCFGVNLQGLVLINPATCYDRSQLAIAGPKVARMVSIFYLLGLFSQLIPLFTDKFSLEQLFLILQAKALPSVIDNSSREAYLGRVALSLPTKLEFMPSSTLSWRLEEWLEIGCAALRESESSFAAYPDFRSLIVVGENDKTLPSIAEAERLASKLMITSKTHIHVVGGAGHASTCGSRLDLAAVIRNRFPELQHKQNVTKQKKKIRQSNNTNEPDETEGFTTDSGKDVVNSKRTSMKPDAQEGVGAKFGMEERYDNADIGLNPLVYWSKNNYQPVERITEERNICIQGNEHLISYKTSIYKVVY
mmetsp:Transcript_24712/g.27605  ORF Transcript_24712/g.27605 Transcript_24712/m.27605 type:complete len:546 (+) Transcript_24712:84-1721(+)|eukprot:CAMPEP_0170821686 /NCGR_PEP_ID=MMETSP0733-20121128/43230_1 /TAXON_ID=186038 /ORGANISM="Fragilariopsis kerguelensis, Strain L26-C5" /LENGTH=545 /DNA_ID=CAMNT_0011183539 /DNA_START=33 /DNA_END=1670 /DNA_ORIENTATION=+